MQHDSPAKEGLSRKVSFWRQFFGACGGIGTRMRRCKPEHAVVTSTEGADAGVLLTVRLSTSNDSCRSNVARNSVNFAFKRISACSLPAQQPEKHLTTSGLETSGEQRSLRALTSESSYLGSKPICVPASAVSRCSEQSLSPDCFLCPFTHGSPATKQSAIPDDSNPPGRMQIAMSALSIRDIAQCDPTIRIRHLKPLCYGSGSVVYKGTWQGLLFAVKFMLYRGRDAAGVQRRVSSLLAAHCMPQHSHLARVYACDMSEVICAGPPPLPAPLLDGGDQAVGLPPAFAAAAAPLLTVRPVFDDDLDSGGGDPFLSPSSSSATAEALGGSSSSGSSGPGRYGSSSRNGCSRFHFSSVIFSDTDVASCCGSEGDSAGGGCAAGQCGSPSDSGGSTGPGLSLQGLLKYLGAQPGDYLLHCVSELASGGNLWHGIRSGLYDMFGPLGPLGAVRSLVRAARGIAQGLHQLHVAGEVHGGLTPANVLLLWRNSCGDEQSGGVAGRGSTGGGSGIYRRRGFTARLADCGMRRLVIGEEWRSRLYSNPELRSCTAPELLLPPSTPPPTPPQEEQKQQRGPATEVADSGSGCGAAGRALEWLPCHDVYSFGALLYCMCTGNHRNGGSGAVAAALAWPDHVWRPLRNLSEACMSPNPAARPSSNEVARVLLVLERRLHRAGGSHTCCLRMPRNPARVAGGSGGGGAAAATAATTRIARDGADTDLAVANAVFLHATAEEADDADGMGLGHTAPAPSTNSTDSSRSPAAAHMPLHSARAARFGLSSMPEVLMCSCCATPPGNESPRMSF